MADGAQADDAKPAEPPLIAEQHFTRLVDCVQSSVKNGKTKQVHTVFRDGSERVDEYAFTPGSSSSDDAPEVVDRSAENADDFVAGL